MALTEQGIIGETPLPNRYIQLQASRFDHVLTPPVDTPESEEKPAEPAPVKVPHSLWMQMNHYADKAHAHSGKAPLDIDEFFLTDAERAEVLKTLQTTLYTIAKRRYPNAQDA